MFNNILRRVSASIDITEPYEIMATIVNPELASDSKGYQQEKIISLEAPNRAIALMRVRSVLDQVFPGYVIKLKQL